MEKFYDVLEKEEGRTSVITYIGRIMTLRSRGFKDPISKAKAEILVGDLFFLKNDDAITSNAFISSFLALSSEDQRKVEMTIRDLIDHYKVEDMIKTESLNVPEGATRKINELIGKVLDDYMEFRITLDTVTPEDSEEIEKILEMSDEEYEAYQEAQDAVLEAKFEEASGGNREDIGGSSESD